MSPTARIYVGNVADRLLEITGARCCVTSPPYWGLRDYKADAQVWGGDSACNHDWQMYEMKAQSGGTGVASSKQVTNLGTQGSVQQPVACGACGAWRGHLGMEPTPELFVEHLTGLFALVHTALTADGTLWVNMGDCYAANRSYQVPDSKHVDVGNSRGMKASSFGLKVKDLIGVPWMLAFALRTAGWYLRSEIIWHKPNGMCESVSDRPTRVHEQLFLLSKAERYYYDQKASMEPAVGGASGNKKRKLHHQPGAVEGARAVGVPWAGSELRNRRTIWTITTKPFKGAHFATFPPELPEPCILAGSAIGDTVLDPFCGSGTTGVVALKHGRNFVGIELNPEYAFMAYDRIKAETGVEVELL